MSEKKVFCANCKHIQSYGTCNGTKFYCELTIVREEYLDPIFGMKQTRRIEQIECRIENYNCECPNYEEKL